MAFNGNWKLVANEGLAAFSKAIGVADEQIAANKDFGNPDANVVEALSVDGSTVSVKVTIGGAAFRESSLPIGAEAAGKGVDGRDAKHTVTVNGNTITRVQKGDGYECTYNRTVDGNNMTLEMVGPGGVKATRKYVRA